MNVFSTASGLFALLLIVAQVTLSKPVDESDETILDLSYGFDDKTMYWPTNKHFHLESVYANYT